MANITAPVTAPVTAPMFSIPALVASAITSTTDAAKSATSGQTSNYQTIADWIVSLAETGDDVGIHLTFCASQDKCTCGPSWNVWRSGISSALKTRGYLVSGWRNYASGKGAFTIQTKDDAKAAKAAKAAESAELAARADATAALVSAAADAAVTPDDLARAMLAESDRLGLDATKVYESFAWLLRDRDWGTWSASTHHIGCARTNDIQDNHKAA